MSNEWTLGRDAALVDELELDAHVMPEDGLRCRVRDLRAAWLAEKERADEARAEVARLRALLAAPSDAEVDRLREVALDAYAFSVNHHPERPPYRAEIRAIIADLRARAGGSDA